MPSLRHKLNNFTSLATFLSVTLLFLATVHASPNEEISRLAKLMDWKSGDTFADIGAGDGTYAIAALSIVGPTGKVFATELDERKLAALQREAKDRALSNFTVLAAHEKDTNLPDVCCDTILLRRVYHHLTAPKEMDASLLRALKPEGKLVIIDFPPRPDLTRSDPVEGVPKNRGGHGIPQKVLIDELTTAGFSVDKIINDWPSDNYCVIFRKPQLQRTNLVFLCSQLSGPKGRAFCVTRSRDRRKINWGHRTMIPTSELARTLYFLLRAFRTRARFPHAHCCTTAARCPSSYR